MGNSLTGWFAVFITVVIIHCTLCLQHEEKRSSMEYTVKVVSKNNEPILITAKSNATSNSVSLSYRQENGDYFSWMISFSMGLQILKATLLGEIDKGEPKWYYICFVHNFKDTEFIPFDVFLKLSQETLYYSGEASVEKPIENKLLDQQIKSVKLDPFGTIISTECAEAQVVYTTSEDVKQFSNDARGADFSFVTTAHIPAINISVYPYCKEAAPLWELGCICRVDFVMHWYPCEVKLCNRPSSPEGTQYMCGILSCAKITSLLFYVDQRRSCFWN